MERETITGSWGLVKFTITSKLGDQREWGQSPSGLLIYGSDGRMSVSINALVSPGASQQERFNSMLFYAGDFTVRGTIVSHLVRYAIDVSRVGKTLEREVSLDGRRLELVGHGAFGKATIVWERLPAL